MRDEIKKGKQLASTITDAIVQYGTRQPVEAIAILGIANIIVLEAVAESCEADKNEVVRAFAESLINYEDKK